MDPHWFLRIVVDHACDVHDRQRYWGSKSAIVTIQFRNHDRIPTAIDPFFPSHGVRTRQHLTSPTPKFDAQVASGESPQMGKVSHTGLRASDAQK